MYITNPDSISENKKYKCNEKIAKWLQYEKKIPLLAIEGEFYIFMMTKELKDILLEIPFII